MRLFQNTNIDFLGKRKKFYLFSLVFITVGFLSFFLRGLPIGIDFIGGTELQLRFQNDVDVAEMRNAMTSIGFEGMEIKTMGSDRDVLLRTPMQSEGEVVSDKIKQGIKDKIPNNNFEVLRTDKVGPKIGSELREKAILAVIFAILAILIYLSFRFQFVYAVGSVIALFHDVLITIAAIGLFNFVFPGLRLELNQTMLAAFLTLVGYSVNDTVVVFDRIKENMRLFKNEDILTVMNKSVNATLGRTIVTGGTVFLAVLVLLIFGGEVNRSFAFTFAIGVITGTYSSIFIASAIVVDWKKKIQESARVKSVIRTNTSKAKNLSLAKK